MSGMDLKQYIYPIYSGGTIVGQGFIAESIYDEVVNELVEFTGENGGTDNIVDTCTGAARFWLRPKRKVKVN